MKKFILMVLSGVVILVGLFFFFSKHPFLSKGDIPVPRDESQLPSWEDAKIYQNKMYGFSLKYPAVFKDVRETKDGVTFAIESSWPWEYGITVTSTKEVSTLNWLASQDELVPGRTPKEGQAAFLKAIENKGHQFIAYQTWRMNHSHDDVSPYLETYSEVTVVHKGHLYTILRRYPKKYGEDIDPTLIRMAESFHFID